MAAEGHVNIKVNGSVRLVGDVPNSRGGARTTTSVPPEMSTTFIETTTTLSTTTTRKQRSPPTIQVNKALTGAKLYVQTFLQAWVNVFNIYPQNNHAPPPPLFCLPS